MNRKKTVTQWGVKYGARSEREKWIEDVRHLPATRSECLAERAQWPADYPCPYVSCRYHLYLDVNENGSIQFNFPYVEVWELEESCALDLAQPGGMTLREVGEVMGVSRERIRQIHEKALKKIIEGNAGGDVLISIRSILQNVVDDLRFLEEIKK
jgi:predicted DNA-binding protein (UPF0251 family)